MAVIDLRYARALADVTLEQKLNGVVVQGQLNDFAEVLEQSKELRQVLADPSIPEGQKLKVLEGIAGKLSLEVVVRNFLAVVIRHQRMEELRSMMRAYESLMEEGAGITEAEVISALPLDEGNRKFLEQKIATLTGRRQVRATYREDPALLGGAVVTVGSEVYDGSIRGQLCQLKSRLIAAGA
ncbi:MAG: ATP synthase F1 subunit delta [Acidobacteriaceae bacterium]